jgi:hypothetical protein
MKGEHEMRIPVRTENGWQIDAILETTYEATKDGETVTLEADTLEGMELLIALREGNAKHEDHPRATISTPDSFRVLLDRHEQRQYEYEFPIRRPDGSEVGGEEVNDEQS